jgi:glutaredoxin
MLIGRYGNIAYQAVPEDKELLPFLEILQSSIADSDVFPAMLRQEASAIDLPADLTLYIAMQCPHCPRAVRQLTALGDAAERLRIAVVDGILFESQAKAQAIRSVPTLILDDDLRWNGQIDIQEVIRQCIQRDPAKLSVASLRQLLENGEAPRAADLMITRNELFPALIDLIADERWSVRLGAMVTAEYLADQSPTLAARLLTPLSERFARLAEPVQGDVVHVLGQIRSDATAAFLKSVATGPYAESVREAAAEALEEDNPAG